MATGDPYGSLKSVLPLLDLMHRWFLPGVSRDMASFLKSRGAEKVLDVACGTGFVVCRLREASIGAVGLDLSRGMLSVAASKAGRCGFVQGDGARLPFSDNSLDGALITLALHEVPGPVREAVWSEMKRVVRPGGLLLAMDFSRLPARRNLYSWLVAKFILRIEKGTLRFDPGHWPNSLKFQEIGGVRGWLLGNGDQVVQTREYAGGNLVLAAVENGGEGNQDSETRRHGDAE